MREKRKRNSYAVKGTYTMMVSTVQFKSNNNHRVINNSRGHSPLYRLASFSAFVYLGIIPIRDKLKRSHFEVHGGDETIQNRSLPPYLSTP